MAEIKHGDARHGNGGRRKPKKAEEGLKVDAPLWMMSWADMVTLLMALFVAMYSISTLDIVKFQKFLEGIRAEFSSEESEGQSALEALAEGKLHQVLPEEETYPRGTGRYVGDSDIRPLVEGWHGRSEKVRAGTPAESARVLFEEGSATLTSEAKDRLRRVAAELQGYATVIDLRGHASAGETDSPRNLAYVRAMAVYDFLTDPRHGKIPDKRFKVTVMGIADRITPDQTALEKAQNRRVEVVESPEYPRETPGR